jgi:hypothetical protein
VKDNNISTTLGISDDDTLLASRKIGILTEASGSNPEARIIHDENSIVLDLKSPRGITTDMQLLSLPQWQHLSEARATVVWPHTKEGKINIVFSAPSHPLFEVSDTLRREKAYLPLHIQKDQRAVRLQKDEKKRNAIENTHEGKSRIQDADESQ